MFVKLLRMCGLQELAVSASIRWPLADEAVEPNCLRLELLQHVMQEL